MKKILLLMMFCLGMGLSVAASPAQACDDDNAGDGSKMTKVTHPTGCKVLSIRFNRDSLSIQVKKRKFSYTKQNEPVNGRPDMSRKNSQSLKFAKAVVGDVQIKDDPVLPPGTGHPNGGVDVGVRESLNKTGKGLNLKQ